MNEIKLIAFDLDGTLLNSKKEIPVDFFEFVRNHKEYKYCLSSGRQYYALYKDFKEIDDYLFYIADNGAFIFKKGEPIYQNTMKKEDVLQMIDSIYKDSDTTFVVCGLKSAYMSNAMKDKKKYVDMYYDRLEFLEDIKEAARIDEIAKIAYYVEDHNAKDVEKTLPKLPVGICSCVSGNDWIDIAKIGISKGEAITHLQEKLGITKDNCMCFGDYMNDYVMFKECKYSIAMANACEELKDIAYKITASNDDNGVMKILQNIENL